MSSQNLTIEKFPFFIGVLDTPDKYDLPKSLPITLSYDPKNSLIKQNYSAKIAHYLEKSYIKGSNISANLGQGSFGVRRANDVLKYLKIAMKNKIKNKSILEIGCADGYILGELLKLGAKKVLGCEPNQSNINKNNENGVKIINDFYTPEKVNEKFHVVISLGVLEHINGPHNFVKSQIESLKSNGILFFSVPNCENKLMLGDLKLLQHEHWNYFTRNSITELLKSCGLKNIKTVISLNDANIFAWANYNNDISIVNETYPVSDEQMFINFYEKVKKSSKVMIERAKSNIKDGKTMGFISGGLELMSILPCIDNPRFFDNDISKHGKFFPGYLNPIENPQNIKHKPINDLWICATDYDDEIINSLKDIISNEVNIFSIKDMLLSL